MTGPHQGIPVGPRAQTAIRMIVAALLLLCPAALRFRMRNADLFRFWFTETCTR